MQSSNFNLPWYAPNTREKHVLGIPFALQSAFNGSENQSRSSEHIKKSISCVNPNRKCFFVAQARESAASSKYLDWIKFTNVKKIGDPSISRCFSLLAGALCNFSVNFYFSISRNSRWRNEQSLRLILIELKWNKFHWKGSCRQRSIDCEQHYREGQHFPVAKDTRACRCSSRT